jgi:hypothetical protein
MVRRKKIRPFQGCFPLKSGDALTGDETNGI